MPREFSPWFTVDTPPVRTGAYQTRPLKRISSSAFAFTFRYWNGMQWGRCQETAEQANASPLPSPFQPTEIQWRGVLDQPVRIRQRKK